MEKKKVILTLCKSFPVTHSKAGEATDFEKKLKDKSKIHTIRYNAKNVWNGRYKDIVSGKKYLFTFNGNFCGSINHYLSVRTGTDFPHQYVYHWGTGILTGIGAKPQPY